MFGSWFFILEKRIGRGKTTEMYFNLKGSLKYPGKPLKYFEKTKYPGKTPKNTKKNLTYPKTALKYPGKN